MRTKILIAVVASVALVGCSSTSTALYRMTGKPPFNPEKPKVYVVQGNNKAYIVVDQEPITFVKDSGNVKIKWQLQDSNYKFEKDSIKITAKPISGSKNPVSGCNPDGTGDSDYSCDNDTSVPGTFKYTIKVTPRNPGDPTPLPLDPSIVNN